MPLSAIEGLAAGCAIICSESLGLASFVKKYNCGKISDKLKNADIKEIFNDLKYNKNARKVAEKYFNIEHVATQYKEIIKS